MNREPFSASLKHAILDHVCLGEAYLDRYKSKD